MGSTVLNPVNHDMDLPTLRRNLRQARRSLSPQAQQAHALALTQHFLKTPSFKKAKHVSVYLAHQGEIDLRYLIDALWQHGKRCYVPVLAAGIKNRLIFLPWKPSTITRPNRFDIAEPFTGSPIPIRCLDLLLMPLVGFDLEGNRLGMGGGFYDLSLSCLRHRKIKKPKLIGVAHQLQCIPDGLPSQSWDVPLDGVITEQGVRLFNKTIS